MNIKNYDKIKKEKIEDYINNNLDENDIHDIEKLMLEDDFTNDAIEGLQLFDNTKNANNITHELNSILKKKLEQKKGRKRRTGIDSLQWTLIAVGVIIMLCLVAYFFIQQNKS